MRVESPKSDVRLLTSAAALGSMPSICIREKTLPAENRGPDRDLAWDKPGKDVVFVRYDSSRRFKRCGRRHKPRGRHEIVVL